MGTFSKQTASFDLAHLLVRLFYACQFVILCNAFENWLKWREGANALTPLWPVFWVNDLGIARSAGLVVILYTVGLTAAAVFPGNRLCRMGAFVGLFLYSAFDNSFGKIGHGLHAWIYVAFVLVFLPDGLRKEIASRRISRQKYLSVFLAAQAMVLMLYSLSGFWKFSAGVVQALAGEAGAFSLHGFAYQVADRLLQTGSESLLGPLLILNPWIGCIFLLLGIYFELFALTVLPRPSLHPVWGLALIGMHLGSALILTVSFLPNILLLGILLVGSPFAPANVALRRVLFDLPPFALLNRSKH